MTEPLDVKWIQMALVIGIFVLLPAGYLILKIISNIVSLSQGIRYDGPATAGPMSAVLGSPRFQSVDDRVDSTSEGMLTRKDNSGLVVQNQAVLD